MKIYHAFQLIVALLLLTINVAYAAGGGASSKTEFKVNIDPAAVAAKEAQVAAGQEKSAMCVACHGADGNSLAAIWPKIAGQNEKYTIKQLQAFKAGAEGGRTGANAAQMYGMAAVLSDEDMADIAAYYAAQKVSPGVAADELAERGEAIYRGGVADSQIAACMACHGPAGEGNAAAAYPALAGQHADYTYAQLKAFQSGERYNDMNAQMRNLVTKMTDADMRAVAEYIQGLY